MTERLLQYIWQFQYFNTGDLRTSGGEFLQVIQPGVYNINQGPDFLNAKIKLDNTLWAGSIEIHLRSGDWDLHQHSADPNYTNVILHVVWQDDGKDRAAIPVLELQERIPRLLLQRYDELMHSSSFIPCEKNIQLADPITWISWKERLLVERLQKKTQAIFDLLKTNSNNWEETCWWLLARNFGAKVNSDAFESIARSLPFNIMAKHRPMLLHLEALLLGQAGLLEKEFRDKYPILLQKEYRFYKRKYKLPPTHTRLFFLRMRPSNFPTLRLAQLATLIHQSEHFFVSIKEAGSLKEIKALLQVTANDYWHYHYIPDEASGFRKKHLGAQMTANLIINSIVPIVFAYGQYHDTIAHRQKALSWLEELAAEQHHISRGFDALGIDIRNAFDSQALLQLKQEYCDKKRCLDCAVGNKLLR